ncbi:MAG: NnrU family protein [Myxococcales bacterium]|jgi:protein-S-isoprenylcysteine O-methyltransferase Ste14
MSKVLESKTAYALAGAYSAVAYLLTLGAFAGLFCFLMDVGLPRSVDDGPGGPVGLALVVDVGLILVFGLQHTVMARPSFKRWWTRTVPQPIERSTYMLLSLCALALLYWQWRPISAGVWDLHGAAAWVAYGAHALGWVVLFVSIFLLDHLELTGLRQTWLRGRGGMRRLETPLLYRFVRHPMMVGWIIIFWATPRMTVGHLLLAAGMSAYILVALHFEERNLVDAFGAAYQRYQRDVPRLLPVRMGSAARRAASPTGRRPGGGAHEPRA